jgi:protein TonB
MAAERPAEPTPQESDRRTLLLIAAAVVLVLAIALGLRLMHGSADAPAPAVTTTAPQPSVAAPVAKPAIAAPAAPSVAASVIHQVMPEISAHARNSIHGTVKVRVRALVDQNGHVSSAKLAQRGPSPYFARQALDAAKHWSFAAPVHNGAPQASEWTIRFDFRKSGTKADAQLNTSR